MSVAIGFSVLGGLLELAGLVTVVFEIRSDRELAERYLDAIENDPPPGLGSPLKRPEMQLVEDIEMRRGSSSEQVQRLRQTHGAELRRTQEAANRAIYRERARFQGFVRDLLQGGLGQRKLGALLIALGIVFTTAGTVASSL